MAYFTDTIFVSKIMLMIFNNSHNSYSVLLISKVLELQWKIIN